MWVYVGDMSIITEEIFAQIFCETTPDEYIDFGAETVASEPAVDPTHVKL